MANRQGPPSFRDVNHPGDDAAPTPRPLEYFAANEPRSQQVRGLNFFAVLLVLAWAPYVCGIVNASTMMASYSPLIVATHANGAMLFMGIGLALAIASLIGFVVQRHVWGALAAGVVIAVQSTLAACAGLAAR